MEDNKQLDACVDEIYTLMPKWHTKIAVSYTHLDVYKRQTLDYAHRSKFAYKK